MPFIMLTGINLEIERDWLRGNTLARNRVIESDEDDLEQPIDETPVTQAPSMPEPAEMTYEMVFNTDEIRLVKPRKGGRSGSRITSKTGAGYPVKESVGQIKVLLGLGD
jgi:hypothetical protein